MIFLQGGPKFEVTPLSFTYLSSLAGPRSCLPPITDVCRITSGLINSRNGLKIALDAAFCQSIIKNDDDDDDDGCL